MDGLALAWLGVNMLLSCGGWRALHFGAGSGIRGTVCEARFCFAAVKLGAEGWLKLAESLQALTTLRSLSLKCTTFLFRFRPLRRRGM